MRTQCSLLASLLIFSLVPRIAEAQDAPSAAPAASNTPADRFTEARNRYDLGVKLYYDGNYQAARIEFERAMSLAPSYRILYNIGLTYRQLNNYVDALSAFERYLAEGGAEVAQDRRQEVEKAIAELRPRIAHVTLSSNVGGTEVQLDGQPVGKTPFEKPVAVNPGVRAFSFQARGYFPSTKTITVGSSDTTVVAVTLQELPKTVVLERRSNPWVIPTVVGWSAAGAAAIAGGVLGALALHAKSEQNDLLNSVGSTQGQLTDARNKTQNLAGAADALFITTGVFAVASAYLTYRLVSTSKHEAPPEQRSADLSLTIRALPSGVFAMGTF